MHQSDSDLENEGIEDEEFSCGQKSNALASGDSTSRTRAGENKVLLMEGELRS